ncbi:MAG: DNA-binding protein [Lewinellaceae bacterium]|nr:DNA-binding protein [Lewinellaceae bacterium]MBK9337545.1 DNA-binding protein [Lewinellaceae bacterium]
MSSITLNFEDKQLVQLRAKAKEMQLASVEELLLKIATDLLESREAKFETAMQYVLKKNTELYKRLA